MTSEDRRWMQRAREVLDPVWPWVQPPGESIRPRRLAVYAWLMRAHRWAWVRGLKV